MPLKILVKGAGEHASGTAHRLFRCGFHVAMTELAEPRAVRRTVSFCSAVFLGEFTVEGVSARVHGSDFARELDSFHWEWIPVFRDPRCQLRPTWQPDVIIDARILKKNLDNHIDDAPLVVAYGPGIRAGRDVHYVVETSRGHHLGRIIQDGLTSPDTARPGIIAGYSTERVLRAPCQGSVQVLKDIGTIVQAGDTLALVEGRPIVARIPGVLRGMVHPGLRVRAGQKLGDVDPRASVEHCFTISDKARTISGAALEIILGNFPLARP